jgi:hypothetical protein
MSNQADRNGEHDFDFLVGAWHVQNRCLRRAFESSTEWYEFPATVGCRHILDGRGTIDEYRAPSQGLVALALRLFDPSERTWSIYWATRRDGILGPPVVGRFTRGRGDFSGDDTYEGRTIRVHFTWSAITPTSARWEQAFSDDGGETWEPNWVMEFTRVASTT